MLYGRSAEVRTPGLMVPNQLWTVFAIISPHFKGFPLGKPCFRDLLRTLFPPSPLPYMVKGVVKPVSVGYGRYQEIENPTPQKFFFCRNYTINRRNSQAPSLNTKKIRSTRKICGAVVKENAKPQITKINCIKLLKWSSYEVNFISQRNNYFETVPKLKQTLLTQKHKCSII